MSIAIILQARMNSKRLPGKVMAMVENKPLIEYTLERLKQSIYIYDIIVATSDKESDDPITDYCKKNNIQCLRGELDDVASRFVKVIKAAKLEAFIRISADSPLIDSHLIDSGYEIFNQGKYDIVTNVMKRSFPKGQSFEIFNSQIFIEHYEDMADENDFEHVTPYFYRNKDQFCIYNMESPVGDCSEMNLSIDTIDDLNLFSRMINGKNRTITKYGWEELFKVYQDALQYDCQT